MLYDALVDERVLRFARKAQRFFVGKRAGRHALTQPAIEALMIRAARRGRRVVRLKGGDPFVFGRGGEEALALQRAGVPLRRRARRHQRGRRAGGGRDSGDAPWPRVRRSSSSPVTTRPRSRRRSDRSRPTV